MAAPVLMLTGATGFLGQRLLPGLAKDWRVICASRTAAGPDSIHLDLAQEGSLSRAFEMFSPSAVVHAAAIADPDTCERDPILADRVNVQAVESLARLCAESTARLVHFSTDLVFDGAKSWYTENDAARPLSAYGRGKLQSEEAVLTHCPGAVVLRISNCYGKPLGRRTCYLDHLRQNLEARRPVACFTDQWRTSTAADQLPEVLGRILARRNLQGVFHWGGAERATRYEAALTLCRVMGYDERLVQPALARHKQFPAARPCDTSLDSSRLATALGVAPVGIRDGFAALKGARGQAPL